MFDIKYMPVFTIQFNIFQNNINEEKNMILNGRIIKKKAKIFMTFNKHCIFGKEDLWVKHACLRTNKILKN